MSAVMLMMLAQGNSTRVRGIRDSFSGSGSEGGSGSMVLMLVLGLTALMLAYAWLRSRNENRTVNSSVKLFEEALASLGLGGNDESLLKRVVREMRIEKPTRLLLSAGYFDRITDEWIATSPQPQRQKLTERLLRIRNEAFADEP